MKKEIIFRNQVTVPVLGQGTWNMGENAFKKAEELKVLQKGIELGMTAIDTAEKYGEGRSEILVGDQRAERKSISNQQNCPFSCQSQRDPYSL